MLSAMFMDGSICCKKLWAIIEADAADTRMRKTIVFVGDYVDRGRDSKGVIDFLLKVKMDR